MALILAEAANLSNDILLTGAIETIIYHSPVLQLLPFIEIVGNGLTYNRENAAATREGSGVVLINEPPDSSPEARWCFWWRRGRVELPVQKKSAQDLLQA